MSTTTETTAAQPAPRYPTRTKIIVSLALALGIGAFVLAGLSADTDPLPEATVSGADTGVVIVGGGSDNRAGVEGLIPPPGTATQPSRLQFGIDLSSGWTAELEVQAADSSEFVPLPADEMTVTELDQYLYFPGEGKTIERLPGGTNCVRATLRDLADPVTTERTQKWCFSVI